MVRSIWAFLRMLICVNHPAEVVRRTNASFFLNRFFHIARLINHSIQAKVRNILILSGLDVLEAQCFLYYAGAKVDVIACRQPRQGLVREIYPRVNV